MPNPLYKPDLSPAEYAALMLACTDENGLLRIPEAHFTDGLTEVDEAAERVFEMAWDEDCLRELLLIFDAYFGQLRKLAEISDPDDIDPLRNAGVTYPESCGVLRNTELFRSRRVCRLIALHAPEIILRHEAQRLIESMALAFFAVREV